MERKNPYCPENEELAKYLWNIWRELGESAKGISKNMDMTMSKAYSNVCGCKTPITTLKDLSEIKGVGKWILKQMKDFFPTDSDIPQRKTNKGKTSKEPKQYVPQKNSVAYALLITLFRETREGDGFMHKNELIDAAEASGLSRVPIAPEKGNGKASHFGSSPREWYSGWSCMKTLISRGLVVKSSCPAKYMLTDEGREVANECLSRSGLDKECTTLHQKEDLTVETPEHLADPVIVGCVSMEQPKDQLISLRNILISMGFSRQRVIHVFSEIMETSNKDVYSLWPTILCRLREVEVYGSTSLESNPDQSRLNAHGPHANAAAITKKISPTNDVVMSCGTLKACSFHGNDLGKHGSRMTEYKGNKIAMPPLAYGERFGDVYEVILILDQREQFTSKGFRSGKIIDNICSEFNIRIEVRLLPVGDGIWVARHKYLGTEYVLDFIVERKEVDDLRTSIRDNRYRDQKMRLQRCGLKKMIYLVEGDPNVCQSAESVKTACFTTEILEGFDVQRTASLADTLKKYGYLTQSINQYYRSLDHRESSAGVCRSFHDFIKMCQELDKLTISDVFAVQLMQVPQVTEDIALAVLDMHPTLSSLARAYALLDGNVGAQQDMLRKKSNGLISGSASRNIYQLVWGG